VEHLRNLIGENALAAHAGAEAGIVELAAGDGADAAQDFVLFRRDVALEPLLENRRDGQGRAQDLGAGLYRPGSFGRGQDRGDHLGDDADRFAELGQHGQAPARQLQPALDGLVAIGCAGATRARVASC